MNHYIVRSALVCLAALAFQPVHAAFDSAALPADARWVFHIDLNALRETAVGKELMTIIEKNTVSKTSNIPIDAKKAFALLQSATAYGTTFSKNPQEVDGTLLLQGNDDLKKIAEASILQAAITHPEEITEIKTLPFAAYSVKGEVTVAFPPEPIILISRSQPQLLKALELHRGKGLAATRGPSALKNLIPKTKTLLVLAATEVPNTEGLFAENAPQARILQMASSASIAISSQDEQTTALLQLVATDDEMSEKLLKIVQGLTAMLSLAQSDDKVIADFLRSIKAERVDKIVKLNLSFPSESLATMIRGIEQSSMKRRQRNGNDSPSRNVPGTAVDSWVADADTGSDTIAAESLLVRTVENVALKNGTTVYLAGQRRGGENARFDYVEITPAGGGSPLRFEAENMKLTGYRVEKSALGSGGRLIIVNENRGHARFEFPGVDGLYTLKVRYVDENDGKALFAIRAKDPEPVAGDEPTAPAAPAATTPTRPAAD